MDVQYLSETYCLLTAFPMTLDMQMLQVLRGEFRWLGRVRGTFDYIMERMEAVPANENRCFALFVHAWSLQGIFCTQAGIEWGGRLCLLVNRTLSMLVRRPCSRHKVCGAARTVGMLSAQVLIF